MDDIRNTLLLLNGNIDSTNTHTQTQIGDQSGNFWIEKNEEVGYSSDIRLDGTQDYHKSISFNENSKCEFVDTKHLFNLSNREFSIDSWVKFDSDFLHKNKKHTILSKWSDTGSPMDEKLFRFYYEHAPSYSEGELETIEITLSRSGFEFNGRVSNEYTFEAGKVYNVMFDFGYYDTVIVDEEVPPTPTPTPTPTQTSDSSEIEPIYGPPDGLLFWGKLIRGVVAPEEVSEDYESDYDELEDQWEGIVPEPVVTPTETDVTTPTPTPTPTSTPTFDVSNEFGFLTPYITKIPFGITIDLTEVTLGFGTYIAVDMVHTHFVDKYVPTEKDISSIAVVSEQGEDVELEDVYDVYFKYYDEFPEEDGEPLGFREWCETSPTTDTPTPTPTPSSTATAEIEIEWEEITSSARMVVNASTKAKSYEGKLVFEYNGLKGYESEYRKIRLTKDFTYNGIKYYAPSTFEPVSFADVSFVTSQLESASPEVSELLDKDKSKLWIGSEGVVLYPVFRDYEGFYEDRQNILVPSTTSSEQTSTQNSFLAKHKSKWVAENEWKGWSDCETAITSGPEWTVKTQVYYEGDSVERGTILYHDDGYVNKFVLTNMFWVYSDEDELAFRVEDGIVVDVCPNEHQQYLNSVVDRTFKFIPIESYNEVTQLVEFKLNEEGYAIDCVDITDCIETGIRRELDVYNLIDGNWHHVYFSTEGIMPSEQSANEKVTMGVDGRMEHTMIDYANDENLPYIQYKQSLSSKTKLVSIQPFFEALTLNVPYESMLNVGVVGVGHDHSTTGNNLVGLVDSLRVNEFTTFDTSQELLDYYVGEEEPSCVLYVSGINNYSVYDENTPYEISVGLLSPGVELLGTVKYTDNPTNPFEALKSEMGSLAYMKRVLGIDFDGKTEVEIEKILNDWRWKLKFISPTRDINTTKEVVDAYDAFVDKFYEDIAFDE